MIKNRSISLFVLIGAAVLSALLVVQVRHVDATLTHLGSWNTAYPDSAASDTQCQLCHISSSGGNGWNGYGWGLREALLSGSTINDAMEAMEAADSDGNGVTDRVEIDGGFQPGWTAGEAHVSYRYDIDTGETVTEANKAAPIAIAALTTLDPVLPITNPISAPIASGMLEVGLTQIVTGLLSPLVGTFTPSLPNYMFIADQPGQVYQLDLTTQEMTTVLDVSAQMPVLGAFGNFDERGLLGLAFHPDYATNGLFYTYQSETVNGDPTFATTVPAGEVPDSQGVLSEWTVANPAEPILVVDPASERELFRVDQPQFNHNGADIVFGSDGMLYVSLGDGGGADDTDGQPFLEEIVSGHLDGNAQNAGNVLGSILRLDPTGSDSANGEYGIPADNPFVGDGAMLDEIYAYGFRNVYRMSFDPATGELYAGDVGQNDIEELNIITAGGNYGWKYKEGTFFFVDNGAGDGYVTDVDPGDLPTDLIDPIAEYDHDEGISIIGGFHYTGSTLPELTGQYIFGEWSRDFITPLGRLLYLSDTNEIMEFNIGGQDELGYFVQGFGQDANGEIYVLGNTTGNPYPHEETGENTGVILQIETYVPTAVTLSNTASATSVLSTISTILLLLIITAAINTVIVKRK